jgi:hypothetical protein
MRKPNITMRPDPIPIRLIKTWSKVNVAVDMPRIMVPSPWKTVIAVLFPGMQYPAFGGMQGRSIGSPCAEVYYCVEALV